MQIKSRVWTERYKKMAHKNFSINSNGHVGWSSNAAIFADAKDAIVMLFTNCFDKNHNEIFHNDICKVFIMFQAGEVDEMGHMYGVVEWVKNKFTIIPFRYESKVTEHNGKVDKIDGLLPYDFDESVNVEIIGNIFEHPKLLNPV